MRGNGSPFDQIFHLAMKIGCPQFDPFGEKILLGAEVYFPTSLRAEVRITEGRATETRGKEQVV
jgi:hypothetical protein